MRTKRGSRTTTETSVEYSCRLVESGEYINLVEPVIRRHVKAFLINKQGHKCSICNTTTWNSLPVPLICDRIDGDSTNGKLENLRIICPNCDATLPTYKSRNRGKGRKYDRERYVKSLGE